jgi:cellulose synthase/poly-beta-1,6-N-acetylglucosamine synthase-like glycosyltransferase
MVSYLPDIRTVSLAEKIIIPVIYLAFYLFFPLGLLSRFSNGNAAVAIGTFILVRSDVYRQVGGHLALQEEIVEDMHLARLVKAEGKKVEFLDGTGLFFTRFYDSAKAIWEGFSKNTFGAFGYSVVPFLLTLAACYGIFLNPFVQLAINPALGFSNPYFNQALLIILLRLALALRTRHSLLSVVFHPVMVCFALAFALNSIWKIMRRIPVVWKGREYRIMK